MKKSLLKSIALHSAILLACAVPLNARAHEMSCSIIDTFHNNLLYSFMDAPNAPGMVYETFFSKNGRMTISVPGKQPLWRGYGSPPLGFLRSIEAPQWYISFNAQTGDAELHNEASITGYGICQLTNMGG